MIEKLDIYGEDILPDGITVASPIAARAMFAKINELIDATNEERERLHRLLMACPDDVRRKFYASEQETKDINEGSGT